MPFSDEQVAQIMERLRQGEVVSHATCASRYVMTWRFEGGEFRLRDWQEGETLYDGPMTEDEMRAHIAAAPDEAFAHLVRR